MGEYPGIHFGFGEDQVRYEGPETEHELPYEVCGKGTIHSLLPLREVFMMTLMDLLTDKPSWHQKVFDDAIVAKWRNEAMQQSGKWLYYETKHNSRKPASAAKPPNLLDDELSQLFGYRDLWYERLESQGIRILSDAAFDFCIRELRKKAEYFEQSGLIPTLDSYGRTIVKSDTAVGHELKFRFQEVFQQLRSDQQAAGNVDWHPGTNDMVHNLVHPSLYPFVYERSAFINEEVVGVTNAIASWAGKGTIAPPCVPCDDYQYPGQVKNWSTEYSWLPSNLSFQEDGSVKFTSYVNNLHPRKYPHVYRLLERLIDLAIPAWDQVLSRCGRRTSRFSFPDDDAAMDIESEGIWDRSWNETEKIQGFEPYRVKLPEEEERIYEKRRAEAMDRWAQTRKPIIPEPDDDGEVHYAYDKSIREIFKKTGLQVIVKMARIELTPENPDFPAGSWHVEGMLNERICATALYYLDSENITTSSLSFRMEVEEELGELRNSTDQDGYRWLEMVYGADLFDHSTLQYFGHVETPAGRLLAFPNVFQHRVTPFSLKDPTKPGHRSFIALWLVDPTRRNVSTANVPPQQLNWWVEETFGSSGDGTNLGEMPPEVVQLLLDKQGMLEQLSDKAKDYASESNRLPNELMDMLRQELGPVLGSLMTLDEAKEHRLALMQQRTEWKTSTDEAKDLPTFRFCEH